MYRWIVRESKAGQNINHRNYLEDAHIYATGIEPTRKLALEKAKYNQATCKQVLEVYKIMQEVK